MNSTGKGPAAAFNDLDENSSFKQCLEDSNSPSIQSKGRDFNAALAARLAAGSAAVASAFAAVGSGPEEATDTAVTAEFSSDNEEDGVELSERGLGALGR